MTISVEKAKEKLSQNKYSLDAWNILIKDAQDKSITVTREFFEKLVNQFPTCGRFWKIYIEQELKEKNFENAEKLFERSLNILNIDLWKCFLNYLKESKTNEPEYNKIMIEAYDSALKKIGLDVMSYSIWLDHLNFLKSLENNLESPEDKQKLNLTIRKIYHEALRTPMINCDQMWKDYCLFEMGLNLFDSKDLMESLQADFQIVKKVSREYENITRPLERHLPAMPLDCVRAKEGEDVRQLYAWKRYILWERQNPLKLENHQEVMRRVVYAYEQSFLCLAHNFELWHEAACFLTNQRDVLLQSGKLSDELVTELTYDAAASLYERAINTFMKNNTLMYLSYAEFEERRKNYKRVHEIYEKYLQTPHMDPTLIWINYIRFVVRSENINVARVYFKRAREDVRCSYHLYIAEAMLEYFHTKDKTVGFKILHLGAKKFPDNADYLLAYIKYMSHLNEDNNTRVLFERILTSDELPPQKTNEIWSEFLKFECSVGDLASILKVDRKRQKLFESIQNNPDINSSCLMIDRYSYMDLLPCSINELKAMGFKDTRLSQLQQNATNVSTITALIPNNLNLNQTTNEPDPVSDHKKSKYPVPDVNQMLPFKPIRNAIPGMMHSIAGGIFPFPPAVTELVKRLPPPTAFDGPFVIIDEFLKKFKEIDIQEDFQPLYVYLNGEPIKEMEHLMIPINHYFPMAHKRAAMPNNASNNSDDEDTKKAKMDIYKQRQYKKLIQK